MGSVLFSASGWFQAGWFFSELLVKGYDKQHQRKCAISVRILYEHMLCLIMIAVQDEKIYLLDQHTQFTSVYSIYSSFDASGIHIQ